MHPQNAFLPHPEPVTPRIRIWPVFIPFAGCPYRCIYCSQNAQTGMTARPLSDIISALDADLADTLATGHGPYELAFFGGCFTALPDPWPEEFLKIATRYREKKLITRIRCSTRPDAITADTLARYKSLGLDMIELGIQSFDDQALAACDRRYSGQTAREACALVKESGLELGIQLMPGLPGDRPGVFQSDVDTAVSLAPDCVRLYPCVVMNGTELADVWRRGEYQPWTLDQAVNELSAALLKFWQANIPVIRMGLAPEAEMNASLLDGPWHPALGQSIKAKALFHHLQPRLFSGCKLKAPSRLQGELFGHGGELKAAYAAAGLAPEHVTFETRDDFLITE